MTMIGHVDPLGDELLSTIVANRPAQVSSLRKMFFS